MSINIRDIRLLQLLDRLSEFIQTRSELLIFLISLSIIINMIIMTIIIMMIRILSVISMVRIEQVFLVELIM